MRGRLAAALATGALMAGCASAGPSPATGRSLPRPPSTTELVARAGLDRCPQLPAAGTRAAAVSGALPDIELRCLGAGPAVRLGALQGRPAVVNLWAAWCDPCRKEAPAFQRLHASAAGRVWVLGVLTEDTDRDALDAAAHLRIHYPSVVDPDGRLKAWTGVPGLPVTYFGPALSYDALRKLVALHLGVRL